MSGVPSRGEEPISTRRDSQQEGNSQDGAQTHLSGGPSAGASLGSGLGQTTQITGLGPDYGPGPPSHAETPPWRPKSTSPHNTAHRWSP